MAENVDARLKIPFDNQFAHELPANTNNRTVEPKQKDGVGQNHAIDVKARNQSCRAGE